MVSHCYNTHPHTRAAMTREFDTQENKTLKIKKKYK